MTSAPTTSSDASSRSRPRYANAIQAWRRCSSSRRPMPATGRCARGATASCARFPRRHNRHDGRNDHNIPLVDRCRGEHWRNRMAQSEDMTRCIALCMSCYQTCLGTAMNHCLQTGGKHVEPKHFRLMMACAEMCRTAAHFMLINTPHHRHTCGECAEICSECAEDCERVGGMEECVAMCRSCAQSCRAMAA